MLSPASSDQVTLLAASAADCRKQDLSAYSDLCSQFTTQEVRHACLCAGLAGSCTTGTLLCVCVLFSR